jgi:hypothetical protein
MMALNGWNQPEWQDDCTEYGEDDIARGLRASITAVLSAKLASNEGSFEYLAGVLSFAQRQASLFGISWPELMANLCAKPELLNMIRELQGGAEQACCSPCQ